METPTTRTDRAAEARAEAERQGWVNFERAAFRMGVQWADANPKPANGNTSDGHHTFNELYEYRMLYNAHAAHGWLAQGIPVVKSWQHSDGEECFGGGYFVVVASLPSGQVSNHYKAEHWGIFKVPEVDLPPEWDGHTPSLAADRLKVAAEQANAKPHTITLVEVLRASGHVLKESAHSLNDVVRILESLGIEVEDDRA